MEYCPRSDKSLPQGVRDNNQSIYPSAAFVKSILLLCPARILISLPEDRDVKTNHIGLIKNCVISRIEASQDGSPYIYATSADPNDYNSGAEYLVKTLLPGRTLCGDVFV